MPRKQTIVLAGSSAVVLLLMLGVSLFTGATQEIHEHYRPPAEYGLDLLRNPGALRLVFGIDVVFIVLYSSFFVAFASTLRAMGRPFAYFALAAMLLAAMLDILEDHHILLLLSLVESGRPLNDDAIGFQDVLSSTKFTFSYVGLFWFGLAIPRTSKSGWTLSLFLVLGALGMALLSNATPPSFAASLDAGRPVGFLLGFALAIVWLGAAPRRPREVPVAQA